ncbi:putative uridine kinase C227.14 isoform X2 [Brachypodium distachyon]|uniref:putative uridine kinase C227.14 isoform X2 n=1 Tax=Brachypodium distachyon TaxID=15368 RepID=UPI000D0CFCDD|nr:putative uridine kinase C227.14 isoform X2 [Brachypodium distachyon]|eukprot:XP_024310560.1 putative uridine kinase C227.14 isoform X2 [Brachypodium distachyon]
MELPGSIVSPKAAAQARLLGPSPPAHLRRLASPRYMRSMPSMSTGFLPRMLQPATQKKKQIATCYQRQGAPQIEAKSMEEVYDALAEHLLSVLKDVDHLDSKYIVGLAGPPGAGKSTVASEVVRRVNMHWSKKHATDSSLISNEDIATMLPMDGFHLYRSQLDAMEDPKEAHARRGAPWTFNPSLFLNCLKTLRKEGSVYAPSFDHGVGDPVENDIFVKPQHKIVIVEGNYLLLEENIWRDIRGMFDEKWFIEIDIDVSMQRVLQRHIGTGKEPDVAAWRISYNDRPNAELIMQSRKDADLVIRSVDFSS